MNQIQFRQFVYDLSDYYERKRPQDSTLDLWFDEVRNIPDDPLEWIKTKIFKENDTKPSNIPATMWALYNAWLQAHPEKRAYKESVDCPDCEEGWLVLKKTVKGYRQPISHSAPCGRCKQIPAAKYYTLDDAHKAGYERIDLKTFAWDGSTISDMISDITRREVPKPKVFAD